MSTRDGLQSWLDGGAQADGANRLGLATTGSGSIAPVWCRAVALVIDWFACLAIATVVIGDEPIAPLLVFAVENLVLVATLGTTLGHRLLGLRVVRLVGTDDGPRLGGVPGPLPAVIRTVLLCLVIPAVVWDADGRGIHDKAAGTVIVRA